jgi:hypothetical protein
MSGYVITSTSVIVASEESLAGITSDVMRMMDTAADPGFHLTDVEPPNIPPPGQEGCSLNIGPLVDAINAISDQDVEASFNQGQTAYSIKAKVTAGP